MADLSQMQLRDLQSAATSHRGDRVFTRTVAGAAFTSLLVLAGIAIFLGLQAIPAFQTQGWSFLTSTGWDINTTPPTVGIFGMLYGSVLLSVIGLVIAVPAALLLAIFMVFLSPPRLASKISDRHSLTRSSESALVRPSHTGPPLGVARRQKTHESRECLRSGVRVPVCKWAQRFEPYETRHFSVGSGTGVAARGLRRSRRGGESSQAGRRKHTASRLGSAVP